MDTYTGDSFDILRLYSIVFSEYFLYSVINRLQSTYGKISLRFKFAIMKLNIFHDLFSRQIFIQNLLSIFILTSTIVGGCTDRSFTIAITHVKLTSILSMYCWGRFLSAEIMKEPRFG